MMEEDRADTSVSSDGNLVKSESQHSTQGDLETEAAAEIPEDEICGCRVICCSKKKIVSCAAFQSFATAKWALVFFCFANMLQQTTTNGLLGVSISTLEKRFELRSTETGIIASFTDFARVVGMVILLFFSRDVHKPGWIGWGLLVSGIGGIFFSMPHFVAPEYTFVDEDVFNFCGNVTEPNCKQSAIRNYRFWFIVAISLVGIGTCPLFSFGLTYLDENVEKRNSALYNSIYLAMGGLGPAIGYVLGGLSLELYTYITIRPDVLTINSSSYLWVGAWWIGFLLCGILTILISLPILMLPKYLPGTEKHRENRNIEAQRSHLKKNTDDSNHGPCQTVTEVILLLKNKPYVFMTLGMTMNCGLIYGFNTFGAKYFESVFGLTPFHSSLVYGIAAIFASTGAQITSGFVIKKFNLSVPGILKFTIISGILSAACSTGFIVHCDEIDFAGGTVPYPNSTFSLSPASTCNQGCGCSTDRYEPVCADGITYFSPCFAGCETQINETTYTNCSCLDSTNSSLSASSEWCDRKSCVMLIPFLLIVFFCFFTSVLTLAPAIQVTLRCVPFNSRDLAMSFQAAVTRLAGVVPGRILVGFVLDFACVAWSTECGDQGACKSYRRWEVARNNTILLLAQTIVCAIFYVLVLVTYKPVGEDEQEEKQENQASAPIMSEVQTTLADSPLTVPPET